MTRPAPLVPILLAALCLLPAGCGRPDRPAAGHDDAPVADPAGEVLADAPDDTPEVLIVTKPWLWKAQYWGGQRVIFGSGPLELGGKSDATPLVLPVGRPVKLTLISQADPRRLIVAAFGLEVDALPGRYTSVIVRPLRTGSFPITDPDPGPNTTGPKQVGTVRVVEAAEFETWLSGTEPKPEEGLGSGVKLMYRSLGPNAEAPLGQCCGTDQAFGERSKRGFREPNAPLVCGGDLANYRMNRAPGHRAGPT